MVLLLNAQAFVEVQGVQICGQTLVVFSPP